NTLPNRASKLLAARFLLSLAHMRHQFDHLVLGSGIAGLSFALQAARQGSVALIAKRSRSESNTAYAQGGIAAVLAPQDSFEQHHAIDLILASRLGAPDERVLGAYALHTRTGAVHSFVARSVVLATGGAGKVYLYTTNPDVATGDGLAMAHRAGAAIANLEFIQFHPTCLYHPHAKNFLISEALRGEGGILRNSAGERFMERYDPRRELAPRDVVARSIDSELKRRGDDCAFLDMTHLGKAFVVEHFP